MVIKGREQLVSGHIPQLEGVVVAARGEGLAIGTKGHCPDPATMAFQGGQEFLTAHVLELEGSVVTARGQGLTIGTKGHGPDRAAMP